MKISFARGQWDPNEFTRVTSLRTDCRVPFMQEEDCIVNDDRQLARGTCDYHYISLLSKEVLTSPAVLEVECSFNEYGAPLLVLTNDLKETGDGFPAYGHHFEIVAFEEGFNVWELNGEAKPLKAALGRFPVPAGEKITLTARIDAENDSLEITLCGQTVKATVKNLPSTFRAGFTACEGINRFYAYSAESEQDVLLPCRVCREDLAYLETEGDWCLYVQCANCGTQTAYCAFQSPYEKAAAERKAIQLWNMGKVIAERRGE